MSVVCVIMKINLEFIYILTWNENISNHPISFLCNSIIELHQFQWIKQITEFDITVIEVLSHLNEFILKRSES